MFLIYALRPPRILAPAFALYTAVWLAYLVSIIYTRPLVQQGAIHLVGYLSWTTAMAFLGPVAPFSFSEAWFDAATLARGECRGNPVAVLWYLALLLCHAGHAVAVYWTFAYRHHIVPKVQPLNKLPKIHLNIAGKELKK